MKLLRASRCQHCGSILNVPAKGSYRIICGKCSQENLFVIPVKPPTWSKPAKATPKAVPEPPKAAPKPEPLPEPKSAPAPSEPFPEWKKSWKKDQLFKVASDLGLDVTESDNKKDIVDALEKAQEAHES